MDDTTDCDFLSTDDLRNLLPGIRIDPEPLSTTRMSRVYPASDLRLYGRRIAVKIMAEYLAAIPELRARFLREIEVMAELEHPHIMPIITAAQREDRVLYFVMPRVETDLKARLAKGPLEPAQAVRVISQIANALDYVHERGVAHRDVKPGNILFGADDHAYLSDFGVAKRAAGEDLTGFGDSIGTHGYTAPEVYRRAGSETAAATGDDLLDRSGDVYSLGAVLLHCLTGERPPEQDTDGDGEPESPPVDAAGPGRSAELEAVAVKAMSRDPARRYRSCGELAEAASSALARIDPLRVPVEAATPRGRRRGRARIAAALVVGLAAGAVLSFLGAGLIDERPRFGGITAGAADPIVVPVVGDEQVERRPLAGECLSSAADRYVVVDCDSDAAVKRVYRVVTDPEDPNPAQPEHNDAAWDACGHEEIEFDYYWADSAVRDERQWDPENDRIYYFICYQWL